MVSFKAPSGPREYPSIGLLCEADLTKPDIIETAAGDPERTRASLRMPAAFSIYLPFSHVPRSQRLP
jgi:hypothetical protein